MTRGTLAPGTARSGFANHRISVGACDVLRETTPATFITFRDLRHNGTNVLKLPIYRHLRQFLGCQNLRFPGVFAAEKEG